MHSILYLEIRNMGNNLYSLVYYMLEITGNYLEAVEKEKQYDEKTSISSHEVADILADLLNSLGAELDGLNIMTNKSSQELVGKFLEKAKECLYVSRETPFSVEVFGEKLGYSDLSVFDLYSLQFGVSSPRAVGGFIYRKGGRGAGDSEAWQETPLTKVDMLDKLIISNTKSLIGVSNGLENAYLVVHLVRRSGCMVLTVCWLTINIRHEVLILGSKSAFFEEGHNHYCSLNVYIRDLRLQLAKFGLSLEEIKPIFFSDRTWFVFNKWVAQWFDFEFTKPVLLLESLVRTVTPQLAELIAQSQNIFMRVFSNVLRRDYIVTAEDIAMLLVSLVPSLELSVDKGAETEEEASEFEEARTETEATPQELPPDPSFSPTILSDPCEKVFIDSTCTQELLKNSCDLFSASHRFCKDFSSDVVYEGDLMEGFHHCIILDCEGTSRGGCSELGGIIASYGNNFLVKRETFFFRQLDFEEGIVDIISRFEKVSGRYIPSGGIPILTYGSNDADMIRTELLECSSRSVRRKIDKSFRYVDTLNYINDFLEDNKIIVKSRKLSNLAESFGVEVIKPKHSALNDAKTLFNVLARVYLSVGKFVV